jgi:hypothetical protein
MKDKGNVPFEKRRTVRPAAFRGRTVPVSAYRTVSGSETEGGGAFPTT